MEESKIQTSSSSAVDHDGCNNLEHAGRCNHLQEKEKEKSKSKSKSKSKEFDNLYYKMLDHGRLLTKEDEDNIDILLKLNEEIKSFNAATTYSIEPNITSMDNNLEIIIDGISSLNEPDITYDYHHHGFSSTDRGGVGALAKDICTFEAAAAKEVPVDLDWHVPASEKAQAIWYTELSKAWRESETPPSTPEEATKLVLDTLAKVHPYGLPVDNVQGFLYFYGLPHVPAVLKLPPRVEASPVLEDDSAPLAAEDAPVFELWTLPVLRNKVTDGCGFTVYAELTDVYSLPSNIVRAVSERRRALAMGDHHRAREMLKQINTTQNDYEVVKIDNDEILTKKYNIKLRGVRKPRVGMEHETEARDELAKLVTGKCLTISVYFVDHQLRYVGDVYCNGKLLQNILLKKGAASRYWEKVPPGMEWESPII